MTNVLAKLDSATVYRTNARKECGVTLLRRLPHYQSKCVHVFGQWKEESAYIHMYGTGVHIHTCSLTRTFKHINMYIHKRRVKARECVRRRKSTRYSILIPMHSSVHPSIHPSTFSSKYFSHFFLRENVMHTQAHMYLCTSTYTSLRSQCVYAYARSMYMLHTFTNAFSHSSKSTH